MTVGYIFLGLAIAGAFLPVIPTVPFALVAAYCFKEGSPRVYNWIISFPKFGPAVQEWEEHKVIRTKYKILAISLMSLGIGMAVYKSAASIELKAIMIFTGLCVAIFIITRKSEKTDF